MVSIKSVLESASKTTTPIQPMLVSDEKILTVKLSWRGNLNASQEKQLVKWIQTALNFMNFENSDLVSLGQSSVLFMTTEVGWQEEPQIHQPDHSADGDY